MRAGINAGPYGRSGLALRGAGVLFGLTVAGLLAGCGVKGTVAVEQSPAQTELQQIWQVYTSYLAESKRPPRRYADVKGFGTVFAEGMRALKEGRCVAFWGVADPKGAGANQILAYEKAAPEQGGLVVFGDGTVKHLSADEFRAAPKAGG